MSWRTGSFLQRSCASLSASQTDVFTYFHRSTELICRDAHGLFAVSKASNVLSHPNVPSDIVRSLVRVPYDHVHERFLLPNGSFCFLLHRLDSATSGLVMLTEDPMIAQSVKKEFATRNVSKLYKAIVFCSHSSSEQSNKRTVTWRDPYEGTSNRQGQRGIRAMAGSGEQIAVTEATIIAQLPHTCSPGFSMCLVELRPQTGFTHQLRYQCRLHGMPIVGDRIYGDFSLNKFFNDHRKKMEKKNEEKVPVVSNRRLYLHASRVELNYKFQGQSIPFLATATLPQEFQDLLVR